MIYDPSKKTGPQIRRHFQDCGLDVMAPLSQSKPNHWWFQLQGGPWDLEHNLPLIKKAAEKLEQEATIERGVEPPIIVKKVDVTRDLHGAFYAGPNWKPK